MPALTRKPSAAGVVGAVPARSLPADPAGLTDDALARRLFALAQHLANRHRGRAGLDPDDVLAVTWADMWLAVRRWRPGQGASPATYAASAGVWGWEKVRRQAAVYGPRRGGARAGRVPLATHDRDDDGEPAAGCHPAAPDVEPAVHAADIDQWRRWCDPRAWQALSLTTLEGLTLAEAGRRLGVSRERTRQLADRAAEQVRAGLLRQQVAGGRRTAR